MPSSGPRSAGPAAAVTVKLDVDQSLHTLAASFARTCMAAAPASSLVGTETVLTVAEVHSGELKAGSLSTRTS